MLVHATQLSQIWHRHAVDHKQGNGTVQHQWHGTQHEP